MSAKAERKVRTLDLTADVLKFLRGLDAKPFKQVSVAIFNLIQDPRPHDSRELKGYSYYRVDVGEFRIIYRFDAETIHIALVGKRNDAEVYKRLSRLDD
jgi:mRNA interferase RelE/StbE